MADGKFLIGKPAGGITTVTVVDGVDNTNLILPASGTVATLSNIQGFKNLIINGRKQVNQSGLTVTDNAYNYDNHYKVGNNWFMFIDGKNIVSGEPYTLSWDGVATAGYYIGTAGATTINAQTFTSIANGETITPTITSSQILWIKFASDASGSTYNKVQFEPGTTPTPYEQILKEFEEFLVQSCYEKTNTLQYFTAFANSSTTCRGVYKWQTNKRKIPIVTTAGTFTFNSNSNSYSISSLAAVTTSVDSGYFQGVVSGATIGYGGMVVDLSASKIIIDARPY